MSDHSKEAAPDPDTSGTAVATDITAEKDEATSPTAIKLGNGNGTAEESANNGAEAVESHREPIESSPTVQKDEGNKYRENSKRKLGDQGERTGYQYQKRQNKSKYDPNAEPVPKDPEDRAQLIRNIADFYFSDSNLHEDKFLRNLIEGQTNLPVKIEVIHRFNRMKKFAYGDVVAAIRGSAALEVTGPESLEEVRRKIPYDPSKKDVRIPRTVYVKGFGEEVPSSQFDIEAFFAQYGPTNSVRLRRTDDKFFKGSCFVEFQDEETAQSFLALDPKPLWKGKQELLIMSQADYFKGKNRAIRDGESEPNATRPFRGGKSSRGGGYRGNRDRRDGGDRDRDPDDWKKRREDDQKSGFKDNRSGRDNRHQNGRGGRSRGKGNDRDRRNDDRNLNRNHGDRTKSEKHSGEVINETVEIADKEEPVKKRAREDDSTADEAPSKRVDHRDEVGTDAS